jgi:hypothetical protein
VAEENTTIITQNKDERFALDHDGGVALYGDRERPALQHYHQFNGQVEHVTPKPLVHMVCWNEEDICRVELSGRVMLAGDKKSPLEVNMSHRFVNDHKQTLEVRPFSHTMKVDTQPDEPINHALQMRTPLELRFCNPWNVESDYRVEVRMGEARLLSIRLTGATVATPLPCDDKYPTPVPTRRGVSVKRSAS